MSVPGLPTSYTYTLLIFSGLHPNLSVFLNGLQPNPSVFPLEYPQQRAGNTPSYISSEDYKMPDLKRSRGILQDKSRVWRFYLTAHCPTI
jgi:hypothetical protein